MAVTLYIIKGEDSYRFGYLPVVRLWEPEYLSRTWIHPVTVELPDGFHVAENQYNEPMIFRDGEAYELGTNKAEEPVIIDHKDNGAFIHLPILTEGWDQIEA